ncbi:hypothetical protein BSL78_17632 [Apostichopus japonicus]|uniref:Endonuclease-reverse transcriptase n=1 Tax=Stichopus japonicus TaxID=307972 RepID=A0A2G8KBX7_STIJA|nr:hypothetical protein BSL78_17632 [Apostichopus japonicus]
MEEDIKRRIRLASWAFGRLKNTIWSNHDITRSLKVRIYQAIILLIATNSSESWALREKDRHRLYVFEMRCLRAILGVSILDKVRNNTSRQRLNVTTTINAAICKRRLKWAGHVFRMPEHRLPYQAFKNDFSKPRPPGRPPSGWKELIQKDLGMTTQAAESCAADRPD